MLANNAGFNCNAARVLITAAAWPQRQAFLAALEHALASLPRRQAYYPGASDLHAAFLQRYPDASRLGNDRDGTLPWTLVRGADPEDSEDPCFTTEAFCSLMADTALPGESASEFLDRAVHFCNDTLWGTLCATPRSPSCVHHFATGRGPLGSQATTTPSGRCARSPTSGRIHRPPRSPARLRRHCIPEDGQHPRHKARSKPAEVRQDSNTARTDFMRRRYPAQPGTGFR